MVFQTLVNSTARRIPLIKFRKGGLGLPGQKGPGSPAAAGSSASSTNLTKPSVMSPYLLNNIPLFCNL